jgi:uncharacterized protein YaaR (DUF327 family)
LVKKVGNNGTGSIFPGVNIPDSSSEVPSSSVSGVDFSDLIKQKAEEFSLEDEFNELLNLSDAIKFHPTLEDVLKYRDKVKKFIQKIVEKFETETGDSNPEQREQQKEIVSRLNKELDKLTKMLKEEQSGALVILNKLDQIRGLLVDLYY